ncbi:hypothetical protein MBLNU230_g8437t1 [Neophaeotheca triangularis]
MAGKKKKPAANPARGFATTSTVSKTKTESKPSETESTDASGRVSPTTAPTSNGSPTQEPGANGILNGKRELHELTPAELEEQLETSELQQFIEQYGPKAKKESLRQVSRLQTDRRLLRGQADYLSVKSWLPDELMQQILDYAAADTEAESSNGMPKKVRLSLNDDLLSKVWQLRTSLLNLEFPPARANEVIVYLITHPPNEEAGSIWGLAEALEWLTLHCERDELSDYDHQKSKAVSEVMEDGATDGGSGAAEDTKDAWKKKESLEQKGTAAPNITSQDDGIDVSDLESDLEPDELMSVYLQSKAKLYELDPSAEPKGPTKKKQTKKPTASNKPVGTGQRKLHQKLERIESDVLFDQREADARWSEQRVDLMRDTAERRRFQLQSEDKPQKQTQDATPIEGNGASGHVSNEAERMGQELLQETEENEDDDDMLGGMFNSLPGVNDGPSSNSTDTVASDSVTVREFGRMTGMHPKRVLEEACRARDSKCTLVYKHVSPTTYSSRHSIKIQWTKEQEVVTAEYLPSVAIHSTPKITTVTMLQIATPDPSQSEAYVATAALHIFFSGSAKEEKSHLRLPPAFRDLWDEFSHSKREKLDTADRETVKELRKMVEGNLPNTDEDEDEEIIFSAGLRRRHEASRPSTPMIGQQEARPSNEPSQQLQEMWQRKASTNPYQRMLEARQLLPMFAFRDAALDAISKNPVTILCGETGCGKSTQLPAFILEHELASGRHCKVYCTEPRRISAISLATRVSEEMGERKGDVGTSRSLIGYSIRLESNTTAQTRLVYATVGIVLRMLESKDGLNEVTHLVLDEVHERSIDTDFLLIVLRSLMLRRPDLKVVLMSATVDAQKFSEYLDGAPVINVPGRTFPVQAKFLEDAIELTGHTNEDASAKPADEDDDANEGDAKSSSEGQLANYSKKTVKTLAAYDEYRIDYSLIVKLLEKVAYSPEYNKYSKAILIFLPGIAEIRQLNDMLGGHRSFGKDWRVHPLHSSFSSEDQQAAFEVPPQGVRKVVLATNIAETGITIPDVTCVIDTGKHKEMRFDERRQMSRLIQSFIARANAKQRRGRAGRVQEGICFHLFTKYRHDQMMVEQQTPEMLRLSLQDLVMRVKICKLGNVEEALSQALDPPSSKNVHRAIEALIDVGALTSNEELTPLGQQLAKLPLDAQLGKLVLFGSIFGCLDFTLTVAAMLSSKSPFLSPMHAKKQADSVRLGFKRGDSDLLTAFNAYTTWRKICTTTGMSEYTFCQKNFLSPQNLASIEELKGQLLTALHDANFVKLSPTDRQTLSRSRHNSRQRTFVPIPAPYDRFNEDDNLINSVTAWSFYPKILKADGKGWRNIANNQSLGLHPTSVNKTSLPPDVRYMSFYSIMQSSSRFTNAQETSPVADFAMVLLAGEASFNLYAGVVVIDGNRLRFKVGEWRTLIVLKILRAKVREVVARLFKSPGRELGAKLERWMEVFEKLFTERSG